MGLGPSIKMTTLHHFNCPATKLLLRDDDIDFAGVIVTGVSENYDAKLASAQAAGRMAQGMQLDGALVAIDGWGNHHVDFVNVIEQLGLRGIPSVGLSFLGQQGRLVCSNDYVKTIIDFNKTASGYESCVVGQNNLTELDAYKALGILKARMPREVRHPDCPYRDDSTLTRHNLRVNSVKLVQGGGTRFDAKKGKLVIDTAAAQAELAKLVWLSRFEKVDISIIEPGQHDVFVNSNLDFMPIAKKWKGALGSDSTFALDGLTAMITGVEAGSGYQPANIGSSEGILAKQVKFDEAGTPKSDDWILHIDVLFKEGEGRTAAGIVEAHTAAGCIIDQVRDALPKYTKGVPHDTVNYSYKAHPNKPRVALVKIVSGLGNMYDTSIMPANPAGFLGSQLMRLRSNMPVQLTPLQVLDGAIHSLI